MKNESNSFLPGEEYYDYDFNGTFDIDEYLKKDKESDFDIGIKYGLNILSFIVAFIGNLCIIIVILKTKSLRTKFNLYIVNLAIADFLMPTICMWIYMVNSSRDQWLLGSFLCKIHTFVQVTIVCTSVFTLTTVTLDRFLATVCPSAVWITQKCQPLAIVIIWISALSIAVPWIVYQFYAEFDWIGGHEIVCQSKFPSEQARKNYYVAFFTIVFIVPLFLMFTLIIITIVKGDAVPRHSSTEIETYQETRRKAVYMTLTVVIVFCVCWTPQQSLLLWDACRDHRDRFKKQPDIKSLHNITLYMAYSSSAINPIIYYLYNKCFRHALYTLLKTRCKGDHSDMSIAPVPEPIEMNVTATTNVATTVNNRKLNEGSSTNGFTTDSSLTTMSLSD
ncbi:QRFP-like peptide receptor isoform X2 [Ruditapes philippinarum]|uniref:QRFP-like peptide receptor isoform X2 n=1 Tax=Ruditapes philippinarum TaxID=129788 RepID=UPI00295C1D75|nr:QRFP-like peptide receptor isoform X2 [Ruditapes philippinarum]